MVELCLLICLEVLTVGKTVNWRLVIDLSQLQVLAELKPAGKMESEMCIFRVQKSGEAVLHYFCPCSCLIKEPHTRIHTLTPGRCRILLQMKGFWKRPSCVELLLSSRGHPIHQSIKWILAVFGGIYLLALMKVFQTSPLSSRGGEVMMLLNEWIAERACGRRHRSLSWLPILKAALDGNDARHHWFAF